MAMFTLINLNNNVLLTERFTTEDGKRAGRIAQRLSYITGEKYQVRKIENGDDNWQERERARFAGGDYKPLSENLAGYVKKFWPNSFAHVAQRDHTLIAYTKDESKGRLDLQSVATVDTFCRLMADYAKKHDRYGYSLDAYLNAFQEAGKAHLNEIAISSNPVKFATTAEEITDVYTNHAPTGPVASSCMHYGDPREADACPFEEEYMAYTEDNEFIHPVSAYAAGDLAVAYMTDDKGRTIARALVWPEKKIYSRVYATGDSFHKALQALGYERSTLYYRTGSNSGLKGARIAMIRGRHGFAIMPYIDEVGRVEVHGDYFRIGNEIVNGMRPVGAQSQSGYCSYYVPNKITCPHCSSQFNEDIGKRVYTADSPNGEVWCSSCYNDEDVVYRCHSTGRYYTVADHPYVVTIEGYKVIESYAVEYLNKCEYYDAYTARDTHAVVVDDDGRTMRMSITAMNKLLVYKYKNIYYLSVAMTTVITGVNVTPYRNSSTLHMDRTLCRLPYITQIERVPTVLIKHHDAPYYLGVDGKWYHKRYKDGSAYPMCRVPAIGVTPRRRPIVLAHAPIISSFAHNYIAR